MTDHKSWLWRKKPSEKTLVVSEKQDPPSNTNDEEVHILLAEKAELEKDLTDLNDKLSFTLSECNSKDELAKKHAKTAQEALAGWEKAEAKAQSLKEELNEVLGQRSAGEERISQLELALKECMQQLRFVREEKEQRIHDVLSKASKDYEENRLHFEEKQAESRKKIAKLEAEISELSEVLFLKEGHVAELRRQKAKTDADLKELMTKADALEKHNSSLTYEVRVLEKELQIRNEESEFNRRTADATHKQHIENVKKIAKLESECQRLRVLMRKRLPGPAAVSKMRNEVQLLERGTTENRRRATTPTHSDNYSSPESPSKKISLLVEKCCLLEDENNALRESLQRKSNELQILSSRLSQAESQIDDKISCAGSWASGLNSEPEQFKDRKEKFNTARSSKSNGISSDMNLMDDFAEMEKLALVSVDKPLEMVPVSSCEPGLSVSISKVIKIIEGLNLSPQRYDGNLPEFKHLEAPAGFVVRVVRWKASDADTVVQSFLNVCCDLLHGKVDFVRFAQETASTLEWIINHCCLLQDVSSMKAKSESELESPQLSLPAPNNGYQGAIPLLQIQSDLKEEIRKLKGEMREMELAKKEVEEKLTIMVDEGKPLMAQLESQKQENEDLKTQLSAAGVELEDAQQKLSSLEEELEKKTKHCEEMEATCLKLQIQLDSVTTKDVEAAADVDQDDKKLQTDWEIAAASEKLAKCQETIFNLGKQLKALAPTQDTALSDKIISSPTKMPPPPASITVTTPSEKDMSQRSSLLDKMLAEDGDEEESPKTKEIICTSEPLKPPPGFQKGSINPAFASTQMRQSFRESGFGPLAIVPVKKQSSGGLLRKLLWKKRKNHGKKLAIPFAA